MDQKTKDRYARYADADIHEVVAEIEARQAALPKGVGMKQSNIDRLEAAAMSGDMNTLDTATSADLVRTLGAVADGAPEGDEEYLHALDAILTTLDFRSDVDAPTRRWLARMHLGVLRKIW